MVLSLRNIRISRSMEHLIIRDRTRIPIIWTGLAVFVVMNFTIIHFNNNFDGMNPTAEESSKLENKNLKRILYWNSLPRIPNWDLGMGQYPFQVMACNVQNCEFWENRDRLHNLAPEDFDAIMFLGMDDRLEIDFIDLPKVRRPEQRYILYTFEAPSKYMFQFPHYKNFFNWTFTYRRDSDVYIPYGLFANLSIARTSNLPGQIPEKWPEPFYHNMTIPDVIYEKTKMIAWYNTDLLVPSNREWYIEELAEFIDIDVFGAGGTHFCFFDFMNCKVRLEKTYKFYLAFENALCTDYVTEKLFRTLGNYVVPIVYGGDGYKTLAPPMSYIDVLDYETPRALAEYLWYLDKHPEEYAKYFWWKPYYEYISGYRISVCHLCEKLNDPTEPKKVYSDVGQWWNDGMCHSYYDHFAASKDKWVLGESRRYFNLNNMYF